MPKYYMMLFQEYVAAGSDKKKQKNYQNVTNSPLLTGSADKQLLSILCVPELHLLLGEYTEISTHQKNKQKNCRYLQISLLSVVFKPINLGIVDKLITEFENRVFSTKKAGRKFMDDYLKEI